MDTQQMQQTPTKNVQTTTYAQMSPKKPFVADSTDKIFAFIYLLIGYAYVRVQFDLRWLPYAETRSFWHGTQWLTVFVLLYAACVLCYAHAKGKKLTRVSVFWLCALLVLGISYTLYETTLLSGYQDVALHITAAYFTLMVCGGGILPVTSCFLPFDIMNALIIVPFSNIFAGVRTVAFIFKSHCRDKKSFVSALAGVVILIMAFILIIPMLMQADANFEALFKGFDLSRFFENGELAYIILSLPVAAYLYGLASGCLNARHINNFKSDMLEKTAEKRHIVPQNTVYIVLGGIAALYVLFIAVQSKSIFSVFEGKLYGTQVYSTYAREGFFSLCRVAVINAGLLFAADLFARVSRAASKALRMFNVTLSALTMLLLASALCKMLMYISVYGITSKRVLTLWFMATLAVMFVGMIVWQFKNIDFIRITACTAAVLFCMLALCNTHAIAENFNVNYATHPEAPTGVIYDV